MSYNEPKQINAKDFLDDLITRKEAARLLGLNPNSMTRLHNRGTLLLLRYKRGRQKYLNGAVVFYQYQSLL